MRHHGIRHRLRAWLDLPGEFTRRFSDLAASASRVAVANERLAEMQRPAALPLGGLLEYDDEGVPFRGSCRRGSPYYFVHPGLRVELNGDPVSYCFEFDRKDGWILADDPKTARSIRRFGFVAVSFA